MQKIRSCVSKLTGDISYLCSLCLSYVSLWSISLYGTIHFLGHWQVVVGGLHFLNEIFMNNFFSKIQIFYYLVHILFQSI
jgi:hypothetical protein